MNCPCSICSIERMEKELKNLRERYSRFVGHTKVLVSWLEDYSPPYNLTPMKKDIAEELKNDHSQKKSNQ